MADGCDISRCGKCSYHGFDPTLGIYCQYILITGHTRGCEPGEGCDKFTTDKVGNDLEQWTSKLFRKEHSGEGNPRPG